MKLKPVLCAAALLLSCMISGLASEAIAGEVVFTRPSEGPSVKLVAKDGASSILVSDNDYSVVKLAARLFADDVARVSGQRPSIASAPSQADAVIVGTLGHSELIDQLYRDGKLTGIKAIEGQWEATVSQVVENPLPGVKRALVIVGSDRRGTAYGLMTLSKSIGVSPWYWWADVPVASHPVIYLKFAKPTQDKPEVQYRGIFINDEDWGLYPWAKTHFDPTQGNIGPKTYEKVFELMLRLRLNYLWPAMHEVSTEFGNISENARLADEYGIVIGSSHCEPMLYNNVHWNQKGLGRWDYTLNRATIYKTWDDTARQRSEYEAVWTLGIRGVHDAGMEGPKDPPTRMATLSQVFKDQLEILDRDVTRKWGPIQKIFVPYKEVLPIYGAGLEVPPDTTLVWVDDNFGYIRRLNSPAERKRPGGSGVYWHMSYYGFPHSYTWINTTAPGLMWQELSKAWNNEARRVWVINVGDIKPMEIGMDYFSRFSWSPEQMGPDSQPKYLKAFTTETFGPAQAPALTAFLTEFYRLGTIRKPELMNRAWALSLTPERAAALKRDYTAMLRNEERLRGAVPPATRDSYIETIGFPARVLATSGLIFLADRDAQLGINKATNEQALVIFRDDLAAQVEHFNTRVADGKWKGMMPGLATGQKLTSWSSQVRWPWGEDPAVPVKPESVGNPDEGKWRYASRGIAGGGTSEVKWQKVTGLGPSGAAMALLPASLTSAWDLQDHGAPYLQYAFTTDAKDTTAYIDFVPSFRIYPGMKLRVRVSVDGGASSVFEVPGSSGAEDENGTIRRLAVQNNYVRLSVPLPVLKPGKHQFRIIAVDPGIAVDRVWLP